MSKNIVILGSTGSIGTQALSVIRETGCCRIIGLTANNNIDLLEQQILEFKPEKAAVLDKAAAKTLKERLDSSSKTEILAGNEGIIEVACLNNADTALNALVGAAGLIPTLSAIRSGKHIALANKETLVAGGSVVIPETIKKGVKLLPVDSEHSAIFQCLADSKPDSVNKLFLTASGGPFRTKTKDELNKVTPAEALKHPNWSMGKKITIDSASMMNKGLEVIEAMWLFGVRLEQIEVVVHPQSVIHSMVEFCDGAVLAQLGEPDMRVPIQYALTYPDRIKNSYPKLNLFDKQSLTFELPKPDLFPCLNLAYEAAKLGGNLPAVLNATNEIAVGLFLSERIPFTGIPKLIEKVMSAYTVLNETACNAETILYYDNWARQSAEKANV